MSESEFSDNFTHRIIHSDNHYRPIVTPDIIREEKEKYHDGLSPSVVQQFNYLAQAYDNTPEKKRTLYPYQRALQKQVKFSTVKPKLVVDYGKWLKSPRDVGYKLVMEDKRDKLAESYRAKNKEKFSKYSRGMVVKSPRKSKAPQAPPSSDRSDKKADPHADNL